MNTLDDIMQVFQVMPACDRLYLICQMLQQCGSQELVYIKNVILANISMSSQEMSFNEIIFFSKFSFANLDQLINSISLIHHDNISIGEEIYDFLNNHEILLRAEQINDLELLQKLRLLYVLAVCHPVLTITQKKQLSTLLKYINMLHQSKVTEEKRFSSGTLEAGDHSTETGLAIESYSYYITSFIISNYYSKLVLIRKAIAAITIISGAHSTLCLRFEIINELKNCCLCLDEYCPNEMIVMPACGELLCKSCFKRYFSMAIREKSVKHFNCPICGEPDLTVNDPTQEMNIQLFVAIVKENLEKEVYDMFQRKLTEFNLSKQSGFVWCAHGDCGAGFINEIADRTKIECPICHRNMCFKCKKEWEDQHEGITCEMFTKWKDDNDPEAQKAGLAAILNKYGIQCPNCKFRYELVRGGCMHFHCTQCPHEFCPGCYGAFHRNADACGRNYCKRGAPGLHAHHPRDCLFYLRDFSVEQLQKLLKQNNVEFDTDPPEAQVVAAKEKKEQGGDVPQEEEPQPVEDGEEEPKPPKVPPHVIDGEEIELVCQVMLQKETPDGLKDEECLKNAPPKMAGLCMTHYKEYLVGKINKSKVDPIELYKTNQVKLFMKREEVEVPEQNDDESEDEYKARLIEIVKEGIPIGETEAAPLLPY